MATKKSAPAPAAKKSSRLQAFITDNVTVDFSNLKAPDVKFKNPNHNVTVIITPKLQEKLDEILESTGVTKINGIKTNTDDAGKKYDTIKFKSTLSVKDGPSFRCVDSKNQHTDAVPYRGDVIRCKVAPFVVDIDGSISLALNGVQIVDKRPYVGGFEEVEGGFVSGVSEDPDTDAATETEAKDEMPF